MTSKKLIRGTSISFSTLVGLRVHAESIDFFQKKRSQAISSGAYLSRLRGSGMEFAETRRYCSGDDVRYIDWRVTARSGTLHTKCFHEERERPIFLLVDYSP